MKLQRSSFEGIYIYIYIYIYYLLYIYIYIYYIWLLWLDFNRLEDFQQKTILPTDGNTFNRRQDFQQIRRLPSDQKTSNRLEDFQQIRRLPSRLEDFLPDQKTFNRIEDFHPKRRLPTDQKTSIRKEHFLSKYNHFHPNTSLSFQIQLSPSYYYTFYPIIILPSNILHYPTPPIVPIVIATD